MSTTHHRCYRNEERRSVSCMSSIGVDYRNWYVHWMNEGVDICHRHTISNPQEWFIKFSCSCLPWLDFILSFCISVLYLSPQTKSIPRHNLYVVLLKKVSSGSFRIRTDLVVLKSVVPMTGKKWHPMGSQNLIYVASGRNPNTYRHGMCFRASFVFVVSILFWFPQRTHYFWRVSRFLFMEHKQYKSWHL